MLCLNQDGDIPTDNRLDEVTLYQFACLHGHFRRDPRLTPLVVRQALKGFDLNAAEPNLKPGPILTGAEARDYQRYLQSLAAVEGKPDHRFLMIIQLTADTTPDMVREAYAMGYRVWKYYPHGVTTNSDTGVMGWWGPVMPALSAMARINSQNPDRLVVLQVHAEEGSEADPWRREEAAIQRVEWLSVNFPHLRISFEHVSTVAAVELARRRENIGLSVSIVHMTLVKSDVVDHDHRLHPHCWCAPVAKDEQARAVLIRAALGEISDLSNRVYLGLDFAPHAVDLKEADPEWRYPPLPGQSLPPMGAYSLDVAIPLLVALFERYGRADWLNRLVAFSAMSGPNWYQLPAPSALMTLVRQPWTVP